jgi:hypothetical protein
MEGRRWTTPFFPWVRLKKNFYNSTLKLIQAKGLRITVLLACPVAELKPLVAPHPKSRDKWLSISPFAGIFQSSRCLQKGKSLLSLYRAQ